MKKIFCCPALELFHCLPLWTTVRLQNTTNTISFKCRNGKKNLSTEIWILIWSFWSPLSYALFGQVNLLGTKIVKTQMILIFLHWQKSPRNLCIFFLTKYLTIFEGSLNLDTLDTFQIRFLLREYFQSCFTKIAENSRNYLTFLKHYKHATR